MYSNILSSSDEALLTTAREMREKWAVAPRPPVIERAGPGEESVWEYPRPPIVRKSALAVRVEINGVIIAQSENSLNIAETSGAPVFYLPPQDVRTDLLTANGERSLCEWKGYAMHYDLEHDGQKIESAAFSYADPLDDLGRGFRQIAGWFGFYPAKLECYLGDERVAPQAGGYYAGWITSIIRGPVKGVAGSENW